MSQNITESRRRSASSVRADDLELTGATGAPHALHQGDERAGDAGRQPDRHHNRCECSKGDQHAGDGKGRRHAEGENQFDQRKRTLR